MLTKLDYTDIQNHKAFPLWGDEIPPYGMEQGEVFPTVMPYLAEHSKYAVVIFPGGGYFQLSVASEGVAIAKALNTKGISAFVVTYRYKPCDGHAILADGMRAMQFVRYYAENFSIDKEKIALMGFSAGGHLAVTVAEHQPNVICDDISRECATPNALLLGYPVVTLMDGTFPTMPGIFLGEQKDDQSLLEKYSYTYCPEVIPPTFSWYSVKDTAVDYTKNAEALHRLLCELGTPSECHGFMDGAHGIGLGRDFPEYATWLSLAVRFTDGILLKNDEK